jgi:hypothetical protein
MINNFNFTAPFQSKDKVKYIGCSREQVAWGNNDNPHMLTLDEVYTVESVDVHSQHTKISLEGISGRFNSVCFASA